MKDQVLDFLNKHDFCVISWVNEAGRPESAFVAFTCNDRLELAIGTSNLSRKYKSISGNPAVSVAVADLSFGVQYEGEARIFDSVIGSLERDFEKLPGSKKYRDDPTQVWIKITPTWIRFTAHGEEDTITEMTEFS